MESDLLAPLEPALEDVDRPVGEVRGVVEGLGGGLEVWCGPLFGWRAVGKLLAAVPTVVLHRRRLLIAFTFDGGEAILRRAEGTCEGTGTDRDEELEQAVGTELEPFPARSA
jgi:hypothetical protein